MIVVAESRRQRHDAHVGPRRIGMLTFGPVDVPPHQFATDLYDLDGRSSAGATTHRNEQPVVRLAVDREQPHSRVASMTMHGH